MDIRSILSIPLVSFSLGQDMGAVSLRLANLAQRKSPNTVESTRSGAILAAHECQLHSGIWSVASSLKWARYKYAYREGSQDN